MNATSSYLIINRGHRSRRSRRLCHRTVVLWSSLATIVIILVTNAAPVVQQQKRGGGVIAAAAETNNNVDDSSEECTVMDEDDGGIVDDDENASCQNTAAAATTPRSTTTITASSSSNDNDDDDSNNKDNTVYSYHDDDPLLANVLSKIHVDKFYINGTWVDPLEPKYFIDVIDPSIGKSITKVSMGNSHDVDMAVEVAKDAFPKWAYDTTPQQRLEYIKRILEIYETKYDEMSILVSREMGSPISMAYNSQVDSGYYNIETFIKVFDKFQFVRTLPQYYENDPYFHRRGRQQQQHHHTTILMDPVGVVGMITPWNWPLNQITLKVIPALLVGCTCILKPSELSPLSALLFADIVHEAELPSGVFNVINGEGYNSVGQYISNHPKVDMISFTGSTRAGALVSQSAANTFKKVTLELGGKGACIIFEDVVGVVVERRDDDDDDDENDDAHGQDDEDTDDTDITTYDYEWFDEIVTNTVHSMFYNSGQSCNAPSRLLIQDSSSDDAQLLLYERAIRIAKRVAESTIVNSAHLEGDDDHHIGPVVSKVQYDKIQNYIKHGIEVDGATLVAGGLGKPPHIILERRQQQQQQRRHQRRRRSTITSNATTTTPTADDDIDDKDSDEDTIDDSTIDGYYVRPTVFSNCTSTMKVFQEEIFGPVLCISRFDTVEDGIELANGTPYGLTNYVYSRNSSRRQYVAKRLRCGMVEMNDSPSDIGTPFGGTRHSGVGGREGGIYGLEEYCEIKSITGYHYQQDTDI